MTTPALALLQVSAAPPMPLWIFLAATVLKMLILFTFYMVGVALLAPMLAFIPALMTWAVIPWGAPWESPWGMIDMSVAPLPVGFLYVLAIGSIGVCGIVLAGWSSNNKYSLLGGLRSSAQMISYE